MNIKIERNVKPPRSIFIFSKGDYENFRKYINENFRNFEIRSYDGNVDRIWKDFVDLVKTGINKYIPSKVVGEKSEPWRFNAHIRRTLR